MKKAIALVALVLACSKATPVNEQQAAKAGPSIAVEVEPYLVVQAHGVPIEYEFHYALVETPAGQEIGLRCFKEDGSNVFYPWSQIGAIWAWGEEIPGTGQPPKDPNEIETGPVYSLNDSFIRITFINNATTLYAWGFRAFYYPVSGGSVKSLYWVYQNGADGPTYIGDVTRIDPVSGMP